MGIDPTRPLPLTTDARAASRSADLGRQVAQPGRTATPSSGSGPPTTDPTTLVVGTRYLDWFNSNDYVVVGDPENPATNAWKSASLT